MAYKIGGKGLGRLANSPLGKGAVAVGLFALTTGSVVGGWAVYRWASEAGPAQDLTEGWVPRDAAQAAPLFADSRPSSSLGMVRTGKLADSKKKADGSSVEAFPGADVKPEDAPLEGEAEAAKEEGTLGKMFRKLLSDRRDRGSEPSSFQSSGRSGFSLSGSGGGSGGGRGLLAWLPSSSPSSGGSKAFGSRSKVGLGPSGRGSGIPVSKNPAVAARLSSRQDPSPSFQTNALSAAGTAAGPIAGGGLPIGGSGLTQGSPGSYGGGVSVGGGGGGSGESKEKEKKKCPDGYAWTSDGCYESGPGYCKEGESCWERCRELVGRQNAVQGVGGGAVQGQTTTNAQAQLNVCVRVAESNFLAIEACYDQFEAKGSPGGSGGSSTVAESRLNLCFRSAGQDQATLQACVKQFKSTTGQGSSSVGGGSGDPLTVDGKKCPYPIAPTYPPDYGDSTIPPYPFHPGQNVTPWQSELDEAQGLYTQAFILGLIGVALMVVGAYLILGGISAPWGTFLVALGAAMLGVALAQFNQAKQIGGEIGTGYGQSDQGRYVEDRADQGARDVQEGRGPRTFEEKMQAESERFKARVEEVRQQYRDIQARIDARAQDREGRVREWEAHLKELKASRSRIATDPRLSPRDREELLAGYDRRIGELEAWIPKERRALLEERARARDEAREWFHRRLEGAAREHVRRQDQIRADLRKDYERELRPRPGEPGRNFGHDLQDWWDGLWGD